MAWAVFSVLQSIVIVVTSMSTITTRVELLPLLVG